MQVDALAGCKGEETPRLFTHEGITRCIEAILSHWYPETHSCFKVRASDGHRYVLRYDLDRLRWELVIKELGPGTGG